jgi:hypothetical protein
VGAIEFELKEALAIEVNTFLDPERDERFGDICSLPTRLATSAEDVV